jgi:hypothetical protein
MKMQASEEHGAALAALDARLNALLPEEYQGAYEEVQPVSMGSAPLKLGRDGKVAWDMMWDTYCDLAMAGGPPHKGTLLEPATAALIDAEPTRYREVVDEICRGIRMVTGLEAAGSADPGWIRVSCRSGAMAGWLLRAITMENVAVRAHGTSLHLPAAPSYRLEKEIKNVVTVIAKTSHYWLGHMSPFQQREIARLLATMAEESPLLVPDASRDAASLDHERVVSTEMGDQIYRDTGLRAASHRYAGWLGVVCPSVRAAIWIMRGMVVRNVLARREGTVLFVPVHAGEDPGGQRVLNTLAHIHRLAVAKLGSLGD